MIIEILKKDNATKKVTELIKTSEGFLYKMTETLLLTAMLDGKIDNATPFPERSGMFAIMVEGNSEVIETILNEGIATLILPNYVETIEAKVDELIKTSEGDKDKEEKLKRSFRTSMFGDFMSKIMKGILEENGGECDCDDCKCKDEKKESDSGSGIESLIGLLGKLKDVEGSLREDCAKCDKTERPVHPSKQEKPEAETKPND